MGTIVSPANLEALAENRLKDNITVPWVKSKSFQTLEDFITDIQGLEVPLPLRYRKMSLKQESPASRCMGKRLLAILG